MRNFEEGIDELLGSLPAGNALVGSVEMDQVYARYQHEHPEFNHPRGGQAFFLRDALYGSVDDILAHLAENVLKGRLPRAMASGMEMVSERAYHLSPVEYEPLRRSTHPTVTDRDTVHYDRPPEIARLSEAELKALRKRGSK